MGAEVSAPDFTNPQDVIDVYRRRAKNYDFTANLYYLLGLREYAFRRRAADALRLRPGDTVVEIGCGTGLNFPYLEEKIGPGGRIVGVDLTDAMLAEARKRAVGNNWSNVELVQSTASAYRFPDRVDAVLSTFALTLDADYDRVIEAAAKALRPGGRFVLLDLKMPENWLRHLTPVLIFLTRPFAVSEKIGKRRPWESMRRHLKNVTFENLYLDIVYLATGEA